MIQRAKKEVFGDFLEQSVDQVLKFNKIIELSSSTGLTGSRGLKGLTGLTGTNVEPMAPRPCYSSQRQLRLGFELLVC